jgi:type II secretory pathway component PulJ
MTRRRGISLVELMLTLSACCAILTLSAGLIHRALHAQSRARHIADAERSAWRLSHAFRRDVRDAAQATVGAKNAEPGGELLVRLELSGGKSVEYRQASGRVERLLQVPGSMQARETFAFPAEARIIVTQPSEQLLSLSVETPLPTTPTAHTPSALFVTPMSLHVQAALGRNTTLANIPTQEATP